MAYVNKERFKLFYKCLRGPAVLMTAIFSMLLLAPPATALNLDFASWRILKTAHFNIYYHNGNDGFARAAGKIAEAAAGDISRTLALKSVPKNIPLILYDAGDAPFGFTNVLKNKIWVSIALPDPAELSDKAWIESIIRHELTHYLMGAKLDRLVPLGTGRLVGWGVTPMWFIEGVAQREESGWNAVKDSAVRTAVLSNKFLNLSDLQIFYFFNYQGRRLGYHIGNSMVDYMVERFGPRVISDILENLSYFKLNSFNSAFRKVTKLSLEEFFKQWQSSRLEKYRKQVEGKKSIAEYARPLDFHGGLNVSPSFGRDGKNIFLLSNKGRDARRLSLFSISVEKGGAAKLIDNLEDNYFLDRDLKFILFCRKSRNKYDHLVSDIYRYDMESGEIKRITRWLKAASPVYDYETGTIFCVQQEAGSTNLCRVDLEGNIRERITDLGYNCAIYDIQIPFRASQAAAEKNEKIMFLNYFRDGRFYVARLNYDKKSPEYAKIIPVTSFGGMIIKPRVFAEPDGSYRVFFIRDEGGIFNICSLILKRGDKGYAVSGAERLTDFRESVIDYDYCPRFARFAVVTQTYYGSDVTLIPAGNKYAEERRAMTEAGDKAVEKMKNASAGPKNSIDSGDPGGRAAAASSPAQPHRIVPYRNDLKLEYLIPMAGSQSSKSLFGAQGRFADAIDRHIIDYQLLAGSSKYRNLNASYMYRGFKPTLGAAAYDIVRDLRPGVLENLKGVDVFINYKLFDTLVTFDVFAREISSNSISPRLALARPELQNGENRDRGYFVKLLNYSAENTVDADIHPINAHSVTLYHQNSTARLNSFYTYKTSRVDIAKWMMLDERIKNTVMLRAMLAAASGDYDFQLGGHNDLRGYSTRPLIGRKAQLYSIEYAHLPINQPLQLKVLSVNKVYPAIFYDVATAYDDYGKAAWKRSAGIELKTRLLIFRKTPLAGKVGAAWRLGEGREKEFYTAFDMKF